MGFSILSSWMASTNTMSEPVFVGILTDSAMKPIFFISGSTSAKASAAPVVVNIMLLRILLFFLRSLAPALGNLSSTTWLPVAAWTVTMDADNMRDAPK